MKFRVYINKYMQTNIDEEETIKVCDTKEEAEKVANEQDLDLLAGVEKIKG